MLALGFSSGLPFMLVGNTLSYWLRESGIELTLIGFLSWVGLAYSLKFLWSPLTDKISIPLLGKKLGQRRGWMIVTQLFIMGGLLGMSSLEPATQLTLFVTFAGIAAIASATQDIVIDAWRIEISEASEDMALLSSAYQLGYRMALLITDALILIAADRMGWPLSYTVMGIAMAVGLIASLVAQEPERHTIAHEVTPLWTIKGVTDAIVGPFMAFFKQHGRSALLILAAVSLYRLADFVMGPMANPFYADLGLSKDVVGGIRGTVGLFASIAGIAAGGLSSVRFGLTKTLLFGAFVGPASNLAFSFLAFTGPRTDVFALAMTIDNFANGFAGVALVGYMSSLTSFGYTATQYALLSSFYTLLGKFLKGFSGASVDALRVSHDTLSAYSIFFAGTAAIGLPALVTCILLARWDMKNR